MAAIREISIKGFRSISAVDRLELRPLNVLIGANGSGKSNFLRALDLYRVVTTRSEWLPDYVRRAGGADCFLHYGSRHTDRIALSLYFGPEFSSAQSGYAIQLHPLPNDLLSCTVAGHAPPIPDEVDVNAIAEQGEDPWIEGLRSRMDGWRVYHFHDTGPRSPIKKTAKIHDNRRLREDGSNLAAFLYLLSKRYRRDYDMIRKCVRQAAPFFEDFSLQPLELNKETLLLEWRQSGSDGYFNASALSDGTLRFMALATLLMQPESLRPSVILLDEPELGLHPAAITLVASMLRQASVSSQVIVATQSPILLDHFEPEDVVVADRVNGATEFHRLDAEQLGVWLEDFSLGELWEKNHFGGRASSWSDNPARKR